MWLGLKRECSFLPSSRCDSIEKLKRKCENSTMEKEIKEPPKFRDFYQFTFNFAKNPGQKGLGMPFILTSHVLISVFLFPDLDMALAYWNIVMKGRFKFLDLWCSFLQVWVQNFLYCMLRHLVTAGAS